MVSKNKILVITFALLFLNKLSFCTSYFKNPVLDLILSKLDKISVCFSEILHSSREFEDFKNEEFFYGIDKFQNSELKLKFRKIDAALNIVFSVIKQTDEIQIHLPIIKEGVSLEICDGTHDLVCSIKPDKTRKGKPFSLTFRKRSIALEDTSFRFEILPELQKKQEAPLNPQWLSLDYKNIKWYLDRHLARVWYDAFGSEEGWDWKDEASQREALEKAFESDQTILRILAFDKENLLFTKLIDYTMKLKIRKDQCASEKIGEWWATLMFTNPSGKLVSICDELKMKQIIRLIDEILLND